jgi:hypothetical protein
VAFGADGGLGIYADHSSNFMKFKRVLIMASYVPLQPYRHLPLMPQGLKIDFPQKLLLSSFLIPRSQGCRIISAGKFR